MNLLVNYDCRAILRGGNEYFIAWDEGICSVLKDGSNFRVKNFGKSNFLVGGMVEAGDGNFILAGLYLWPEAGLGIIKLDSANDVLWDLKHEYEVESCRVISDGGFHLIAGTLITSSGSSHAYLAKLDENGTQVWDRAYPALGTCTTGGATGCIEGGFALAGTHESGEDVGIFLLRTDSRGNLLWEARYDIEGIVEVSCIIQNREGELFVSGTVSGESGSDAFAMSVLPSGELAWQGSFDSGLYDRANWLFEGD
jgi:hypothetical protein